MELAHLYIIAGGCIILSLVAIILAFSARGEFAKVRRMYRVFMTGADQGNLEQGLLELAARIGNLESDSSSQGKQLRQLEQKLSFAVQRVSMVRYNAFNDVGGEMSFTVALLDALGNGMVVSSIYGRAEARVYAKPIVRGGTNNQFSVEESKAIEQAMQTNK